MPASLDVFQSTPPRGGRPLTIAAMVDRELMFQSTPPRGGRPVDPADARSRRCGFNPRPRAGGDRLDTRARATCSGVSIHAPARGATRLLWPIAPRTMFQSTPPRGGRPDCDRRRCRHLRRFNPRPREGGDMVGIEHRQVADDVSIHAPARGATLRPAAARLHRGVSIHAPARGATRLASADVDAASGVSIHAPAKGATAGSLASDATAERFNPRPREGGDAHAHRRQHADRGVSIHAPAKGATQS